METLQGQAVVMVVCGELHTAALTEDGRVLTWGLGKDGRLGHCNRESHFLPQEVEALQGHHIVVVACGGLHTAALTAAGEVLTWGLGKNGRLGHGNEYDQLAPKLVEAIAQFRMTEVCYARSPKLHLSLYICNVHSLGTTNTAPSKAVFGHSLFLSLCVYNILKIRSFAAVTTQQH
jgi:hypothetical protein